MDKLYNRTNWVDDNAPDIDAAHLNNIESGIDAIDDRVIALNDGLSNYGLDNKFDGNWSLGYWSDSKAITYTSYDICCTNPMSCKAGDYIELESSTTAGVYIKFYNASGGYISRITGSGSAKGTAPSNATTVVFTLEKEGLTPSNVGKVTFKINNAFTQVNNTLNDLEFNGWTIPNEMPLKDSSKVGRVNLGDLDWIYFNSTYKNFYAILPDSKFTNGNRGIENAYCNGYNNVASKGYQTLVNGDLSVGSNFSGKPTVIIKNDSYTNADTFKNAMSGKYLYYELENAKTPTEQNAFDKINESLNAQGLLNKFDGKMVVGSINTDDGHFEPTQTNFLTFENFVSCNGGSNIYMENDVNIPNYNYGIAFYDTNRAWISSVWYNKNSNEADYVAPSNARYFKYTIHKNYYSNFAIYVDNDIKSLKADLTTQIINEMKNVSIPSNGIVKVSKKNGYSIIGVISESVGISVNYANGSGDEYWLCLRGIDSNNLVTSGNQNLWITWSKNS